jgi:hypothetical protein
MTIEVTVFLKDQEDGNIQGNLTADSAGKIVEEEKKANADGARFQTPPRDTKTLDQLENESSKTNNDEQNNLPGMAVGTNAIPPVLQPKNRVTHNLTSGINGAGELHVDSKGNTKPAPGEGTANYKKIPNKDGETVVEKRVTSDSASNESSNKITPKENPFKKFATMTYSVSLYLMGAEQYNSMISTGIKSVQGLDLLLSSGGISNNKDNNHGAKRSKYFDLDFYIDDIQFDGLISGTSVSAPHNIFEMSFTITEPNGLSFLERLHAAVQDHNARKGVSKGRIAYSAQHYLMVVRFYGYDEAGNRLSSKDLSLTESLSSTDSLSEKFIPFMFSGIQFALEDNVVKYSCKAICPQTSIPVGVAQSTIPENLELSGQTIGSLLVGKKKTANDEGNSDKEVQEEDAPSLIESLNSIQADLVKTGKYEIANEYSIEFQEGSGIGEATVASPAGDFADKERVSMSKTNKSQHDLLTKKGFFNKDTKIYSITAGQPLVQVLDVLIRTSSFISDQQNVDVNEVTKNAKRKKPQKAFNWFKIRTQIKSLGYDNIRNEYAYKIKYVITRYLVNNTRSPHFTSTSIKTFRGAHKEYDYWFTGKNTEVLSFSQDYNFLYYQTFGSDSKNIPLQNNARELTKQVYQNSSSESSQGGKNRRNEPSANAASLLYSPADQGSAVLEIIGDPDWIAQSEVFYSPTSTANDVGIGPFMKDGSVNYDSSEVIFSVNYNTTVDYKLSDGLADVGGGNYGRNLGSGVGGLSRISLLYRANKISTFLTNGKFTQRLEGTLMLFPTEEQIEKEKETLLERLFEQSEYDEILMQGDMVYDYDLDDWVFEQELDDEPEDTPVDGNGDD